MILIYSLRPLNKKEMDKQRNLLKERLSPFFITDDDFLFSTEPNPNFLKEMIPHHKLYLFYIHSISVRITLMILVSLCLICDGFFNKGGITESMDNRIFHP